MPLTEKAPLQIPGNVVGHRDDIPAAAIGDDGDFFYGLNPRKNTSITVIKPTDGAKVFLTNTVFKKDGSKIISKDDADIIWVERSSGVNDYFVGDEKGLTGVKVEADVDPTTVAIQISIAQF